MKRSISVFLYFCAEWKNLKCRGGVLEMNVQNVSAILVNAGKWCPRSRDERESLASEIMNLTLLIVLFTFD